MLKGCHGKGRCAAAGVLLVLAPIRIAWAGECAPNDTWSITITLENSSCGPYEHTSKTRTKEIQLKVGPDGRTFGWTEGPKRNIGEFDRAACSGTVASTDDLFSLVENYSLQIDGDRISGALHVDVGKPTPCSREFSISGARKSSCDPVGDWSFQYKPTAPAKNQYCDVTTLGSGTATISKRSLGPGTNASGNRVAERIVYDYTNRDSGFTIEGYQKEFDIPTCTMTLGDEARLSSDGTNRRMTAGVGARLSGKGTDQLGEPYQWGGVHTQTVRFSGDRATGTAVLKITTTPELPGTPCSRTFEVTGRRTDGNARTDSSKIAAPRATARSVSPDPRNIDERLAELGVLHGGQRASAPVDGSEVVEVLSVPIDRVWEAALATLTKSGDPILAQDRVAGTISTGPTPYANAGVLSSFRFRRQFSIHMERLPDGTTRVAIRGVTCQKESRKGAEDWGPVGEPTICSKHFAKQLVKESKRTAK